MNRKETSDGDRAFLSFQVDHGRQWLFSGYTRAVLSYLELPLENASTK
jgi:hypothetical protein